MGSVTCHAYLDGRKKMNGYNVTGSDIQAALSRENVELPSGKLSGNATDLTVRTFGC